MSEDNSGHFLQSFILKFYICYLGGRQFDLVRLILISPMVATLIENNPEAERITIPSWISLLALEMLEEYSLCPEE